jgi:hypothetical protein
MPIAGRGFAFQLPMPVQSWLGGSRQSGQNFPPQCWQVNGSTTSLPHLSQRVIVCALNERILIIQYRLIFRQEIRDEYQGCQHQGERDRIHELHSYKIIAEMNDCYFKLVKAKRTFVWHRHPETVEVFICIRGSFSIELRDSTLALKRRNGSHPEKYGSPACMPRGMLRDAD